MKSGTTLRLILGDQLNTQHSWFQQVRTDILYTLMEVRQETDVVRLHIQKVAGFFSAITGIWAFTWMRSNGWRSSIRGE